MDAELPPPHPPEDWMRDLFKRAGLSADATLAQIAEKMDALANNAAPIARGWWKWLVLIQGVTVATPLLWFAQQPARLSPGSVALITLAASVIFVAALWWVRWRGTQRTWARARLVAEVARGQLATAVCPAAPKSHALDTIPPVQSLLSFRDPARQMPWPEWKQSWMTNRVDDQLRYYRGAKATAEETKRKFTRWTTLFMDVMLALVASGVIIALSKRGLQWLTELSAYFDLVLGAFGALLPLAIILLQTLRHFQELNRRTARFSRQISMLERARQNLAEALTPEAALRIVELTEDQLLSEVVDWYFEAETAEQFFKIRETARQARAAHALPISSTLRLRPAYWLLAVGGGGLLFLARVALGRAPWVVCAAALTLGWLSYNTPTDVEARSRLRPDAALVDESGAPWKPDEVRAKNGLIVVAHGLHDGAMLTATDGKTRWMRDMSEALDKRLGSRAPNIALVDWAAAANPLNIHKIDPGITAAKYVFDIVGIRPQAHDVGDLLAVRLMQWIRDGKVQSDRPIHLIGHSAGGFVVARAALVLAGMREAPTQMRVTILDTPGPDDELLKDLPKVCPVDFYITSGFVLGLNENAPPQGIYLKRVPSKDKLSLLEAHSFAHKWFIETILTANPGDNGFGRSPFCVNAP